MSALQTISVSAFVKRAVVSGVILAAALIAASFVFGYSHSALSIASGAVVSVASFAILVLVVTRVMSGGGRALFVGFLGVVKMAIIGAILWWLVSRGMVEPVAFMTGFSVMVVALIIEGLRKK